MARSFIERREKVPPVRIDVLERELVYYRRLSFLIRVSLEHLNYASINKEQKPGAIPKPLNRGHDVAKPKTRTANRGALSLAGDSKHRIKSDSSLRSLRNHKVAQLLP